MTTLQITFVSESAGYDNAFGWYNSRTGEAGIIFRNTNDDGPKAAISAGTTATFEAEQSDIDAGNIGFFIIPNGARLYGTGEDSVLNGPLTFDAKRNGDGQILDADGHRLRGEQGQIIFSDRALNKKNADYTAGDDDGILGRIGFEDLVRKSDRDYNDLVVDVKVVNANLPPLVNDQSFAIAENSAADTLVGQVAASDPDAGQTLSYAIVTGNESGAFAIDAATGAITVADASKLDFEDPALSSYALTVQVTDNGTGTLSDTAIVSVAVTDAPPIVGTPGNDNLFGTNGDDVLIGHLGNDLLRGGADNDVLNGGVVADFQSDVGFRDTDRADYSTASSGVNVNLASGIAQDGDGGLDTLIGVEGVIGSAYDDVLTGGSDAFVEFFRGGPGNDTIDGGSWSDRAEYMDATGSIAVNLAALAPNRGTVTGDASVASDILMNVEIVYGTDFADSYVATGFSSASQPGGLLSNFNAFEGRAGNDNIVGNGATRIEFTGATSSIEANLVTGVATGDASVGTDTFTGVNSVRATQYADTLRGGNPLLNGFESFEGRAGDDTIEGGQGFDLAVYAFDGAVTTGITVDLAAGTVTGDPLLTGSDTLRGIEGVRGSHRDDSYNATGFSSSSLNSGSLGIYNEFEGMAGNDTITGNGNTRIIYTAAREGVSVDLAVGTAVGGASVGTDTILGGVFAVRGSNFDDVLIGSAAGEFFEGRVGNDAIDGGDGFDMAGYDVGASSGGSFIASAAGGISATAAGLGADTLTNIESIVGTNFGDLFDGSAASIGYSVDGRSGNDNLIGSQGGDFLNGGSGDDTLSGGAGNDFVDGGAGNDVVDGGDGFDQTHYEFGATSSGSFVANGVGVFTASAGGTGTDTLANIESITGTAFGDLFDASAATLGYSFDGYVGDDTLIGSQGDDQLRGSDGNDVLVGGAGNDYMDGGFGLDRADYSGAFGAVNVDLSFSNATDGMGGFDTLFGIEEVAGSGFDDSLLGDFANNVLLGGMGNDLLRGREGADYIDGGLGVDRIVYDSPWEGMDTVAGFEAVPGGDVIDIADLLQNFTSYAGGAGGPLSNFVRLETFGFDAQLEINVGPGIWQPLAALPGNAGLSLNTLVANGNLFTGAVPGVTLIGTPGNDFLDGTPGNDTILADLGNDFLRGRAGNDLLNGGVVADLQSDVGWRDSDRVDYSSAFTGVNVNLGTGIAQDGEGGVDTLIGIESVTGSIYNDLLTGSGAFFESFLGNAGDDMINGAGGNDSADYSNASSGVSISLGGFGPSTGSVSGDASVGFDTLLDVEQFLGSNFADTYNVGLFVSTSSPGGFLSSFNSLQGRGGDDLIFGNGNTRIEYSGATSGVTVNLAIGIATGNASVGTDTFSGVNQVRGSSFDDTLLGGNPLYIGLESLDGRGGNDLMDGGQGWDRGDYGFNGAVGIGVTVNLAAGTVTGDLVLVGSDTLRGIEAIRGSHQADSYNANGFSNLSLNAGSSGTLNEFEGMAGNDTITGNGNTRLSYVSAREGVSVDLLAGTAVGGASVGSDTILGGVNAMRGSNFDDVLMGTNHGVTSAQVYEGRAGNDSFSGRGGFDQTTYSSESTQTGIIVDMDAINAFTGTVTGDAGIGTDTLIDIVSVIGTFLNDFYDATGYNSTVSTLGTFNEFEGWFGNDTVIGNGNTRISFSLSGSGVSVDLSLGTAFGAASGSDSLSGVNAVRGSNFDDLMTGSAANEIFEGRGGNDTINGGVGFDLLRYDFGATGGGTFTANASGGFSATASGQGSDAVSGIESIRGTNFGDLFDGSASVDGYTFDARGGNDTLIGSQGVDTLLGDLGNDLLRGGLGADFLNGGAGSDTYDFNMLEEAADTVFGFTAGTGGDVLDIADLLAVSTSYAGGAGGALADFVRLQAAGPDAQLQIDADGSAGGGNWQTLATLLGGSGLDLGALQSGGNLDILI